MAWQRPRFERFSRDSGDEEARHGFRLRGSDGRIILEDDCYSEQGRNQAIEDIRRAAVIAKVVDV